MSKYTIAIAGSTKNTRKCADALINNNNFEIVWILTPQPKPSGRKKIITANPLSKFGKNHSIKTIEIERKIDDNIKNQINDLKKPDFLLVVDFGYIIPNWLLQFPQIAPLNIHPSELPKWRGSSPAQFSILFGNKKSAITLMVMNSQLDQGPIIHQEFFDIDESWTQTEYYEHAFDLICKILANKIDDFASKKINSTNQELESPTITAKSLSKEQSFVDWNTLLLAMDEKNISNSNTTTYSLNKLLSKANEKNKSLTLTLERASKAFYPWPVLWTLIKGKRMKILSTKIENGKLILENVQVEGKNPAKWNEIKNNILY